MLPLGSVGYEAQPNAKGERLIWLEASPIADRLAALHGPGESYSERALTQINAVTVPICDNFIVRVETHLVASV
jgi:hypothetical protein